MSTAKHAAADTTMGTKGITMNMRGTIIMRGIITMSTAKPAAADMTTSMKGTRDIIMSMGNITGIPMRPWSAESTIMLLIM